jgi:iron complex transport system ATP-binding protein
LDEPTTALDVNHQIGIHRLLVRLRVEHGWTVVTVTHDLNLAAHFSQHVVMMKDGRVAAAGSPSDVLTCERVEEVYGVGMHSLAHPSTGAPVLVPAELGPGDEVSGDGDGT